MNRGWKYARNENYNFMTDINNTPHLFMIYDFLYHFAHNVYGFSVSSKRSSVLEGENVPFDFSVYFGVRICSCEVAILSKCSSMLPLNPCLMGAIIETQTNETQNNHTTSGDG